ncbi:MAG: DUF3892 domain-containing protein [Clostridia bacterium]
MKDNNFGVELAKSALSNIPQPKENAKKIVALVRKSGSVVGYKLSNGDVLSKKEGVELAKKGEIFGVGIAKRGDSEYLKSIPDSNDNNNLSDLPSVTQ